MLFPFSKLVSFLSSIFTLKPGDLIFSGTPRGVGQLHEGDKLKAILGDGLTVLNVQVRKR
jgi:2-keto-4-pentenoate hydratase/2-oxohepta-3-ene-1,7-dioic acid hydratase in catechol pathway